MPWKIWIDTGGTFTDSIAIDPAGTTRRLKVLSNSVLRGKVIRQINTTQLEVEIYWPVLTDIFKEFSITFHAKNPVIRKIKSVHLQHSVITLTSSLTANVEGTTIELSSQEEVPVLAARLLTETPLFGKFPPIEMKLGSTRGTNAILERKGARTAFITTKGFKDLLLIGNQQRPDLFALNIHKEKPLYHLVIEANERIDSNGNILTPLSAKELNRIIAIIKKRRIDSVAIAFLNSYKNPAHEYILEQALRKSGITFISSSHTLSSQVKILPRAETTVANAYLAPVINTYLQKIRQVLKQADLKIMTSAGGLVNANNFHPKDSLLSGPAGGVVGAATVASLSGVSKIITFDMGGTSTDVSLYNKQYDYRYESKVGEVKILSPSLAIETIAAGGGSICTFDGYRFTVGPQSAGASPGPACYGAGGPLTITDVNLLLGRINPDHFAIPVQVAHAQRALQNLIDNIYFVTHKKYQPQHILESFVQIANEKMADAIKKISVQNGYSPSEYTLLSFGGAGGQHACAIASMLNIHQVMVPYNAGLLSAFGIGHARVENFQEQLILQPLASTKGNLDTIFKKLGQKGIQYFRQQGYNPSVITKGANFIFLRFRGQESTIEIEYKKGASVTQQFRKKYTALFGHWLANREIEVESVRSLVYVPGHQSHRQQKKPKPYKPAPININRTAADTNSGIVPAYHWESLKAGAVIQGPAIITSQNSTTMVDAGWSFLLDQNNNGIINKTHTTRQHQQQSSEALLELFSNRFTAIAQQMGAVLQRTSFSVNVKERLDFSCALLDAKGYLIVNAPHIPVHLGSLGVCVREVCKAIQIKEGDVIITNHPAFGGSHLPDVTLIKPVHFRGILIGYVANRAHHSEIGGKRPGSMPADATQLNEEGVIIAPTWLIKQHHQQWDKVRLLFTTAQYPTRSIEENMADLRGALASVNAGEARLKELCNTYGAAEVSTYMHQLRSYAQNLLLKKVATQRSKQYTALQHLDDGSPFRVSITTTKNKITINFTGSAPVHPGNLNATHAIVQSVILYVLRLWVNEPIAMNEGLMQPVKVILPHGLLNPPFKKSGPLPAVVGGNTEVSQRLTDTLLKALGMAACSQGTMNNFLFGNDHFGYYETICGGTGAGQGFNGTSAIHSHMTNTRITDPEILELRYPVRLQTFHIRPNSGGKGKWNGGDGITRKFLFKETVQVSILSQHRIQKPYGLKGGSAGKTGNQYRVDKAGNKHAIKGMESLVVMAGESIVINTPGGGAWGIKKP